jgi:PAS domain S-box-containing protein
MMTPKEKRAEPRHRVARTIPAERAIRVLLVADTDALDPVSTYLDDEHGCDVATATTADAALQQIAEARVDCVVSGHAGSGIDGLALLDAVRDRSPDLPFVLFAADGSDEVARRAIERGADDYLERGDDEVHYELLARRIEGCVTLGRRQQKLENIYEAIGHAGHAMFVTDPDGTITYANPTMAEVSGYSQGEIRGATPSLFKSGEHDEAFYRDLWETILNGEVWESEVINEHKQGHQYVIDQTIAPITDDGEIEGFAAISRDITVRKRRERNLAFFQQAVEQMGSGIAAYDDTGTIRYANSAYAEMLGTTSGDLEGRHVAGLNPEFEADRFHEYWESFGPGETKRRETRHRRFDDGTTFPVATTTTHITAGGDEYHVGTIRDITERKAREQELRMFREAVEQAGHAVIVTDTDGVIQYVNPAFEELSGYSAAEAIGRTPAINKSGEHGDDFYDDLWETILDGEVWTGEIVNEHKNGERYAIDQTVAPLTDDGEITGFVAINRDISELKEQRRELKRQNERLEKFGRTVAHDLRNPLNIIDAHLDRASRADDPADAHERMQTALDRMGELIEELLALAEQGKTVLDPEPAGLEAVATNAWDHVDTREMRLEVVDDATFLMDDSRTEQLLENLYRNAREHAGEDSTVRVGMLEDGFYVEDDGPGIPEADRDNVLESGFTTSDDGTGFGLAIVSQIADAHDWTVAVTEGSDGGARFIFRGVDVE